MQLLIGITAFFAFYVLLLYLIDICLQHRYTIYSRLFALRCFIALMFFGASIFLLIRSKRNLAAFYSLQGVSLLLNFIIQVMMSSRLVLRSSDLIKFQNGFSGILLALVLVVLSLTCPAFGLIVLGIYGDLSLRLFVAGSVLVYGFLGCLAVGQFDRSGILRSRHYKRAFVPLLVSGFTIIAMPASVLLHWRDPAKFLLAQNILSSAVTTSWVILMLYKFGISIGDENIAWGIEIDS